MQRSGDTLGPQSSVYSTRISVKCVSQMPVHGVSTQSRAAGDSEPHPSTFPGGPGGGVQYEVSDMY